MVRLARIVFKQWKNAQDQSFDLSLGLTHPSDGSEKWYPPEPSVLKMNVDAAVFISPDRFSFSAVVRDHYGSLIQASSQCFGGIVEPDVA